MEVLLGIILFFVLLYYGFKLFLRYGMPWLLTRLMKNQQAKYNRQQGFSESEKREGDIRLKTDKSKKPKDDSGFGEYVDFEDVQDK